MFRVRSAIVFVMMCSILIGQLLCFKLQTISTLTLLTVGMFMVEMCMLLLSFHPDVLNRNTVAIFAAANSILVMGFPWLILIVFKVPLTTSSSTQVSPKLLNSRSE